MANSVLTGYKYDNEAAKFMDSQRFVNLFELN